jgi:hypothetical protein
MSPERNTLEKLDVDRTPGTYDRRVFVGGNYDFMADLRLIKDYIEEAGFVPILAYDFNIPEDKRHDYDLRLLHNCKYGIFEETHSAGELMELERAAREYGTIAFVVYQVRDPAHSDPPHQVSSMVKSLGMMMSGYSTWQDLHDFILRVFNNIEKDPVSTSLDILRISWMPEEIKASVRAHIKGIKGEITAPSDMTLSAVTQLDVLQHGKEIKGVAITRPRRINVITLIKELFRLGDAQLIEMTLAKEEVIKGRDQLVDIRYLDDLLPGTEFFVSAKFRLGEQEIEQVWLGTVGPMSTVNILTTETMTIKGESIDKPSMDKIVRFGEILAWYVSFLIGFLLKMS